MSAPIRQLSLSQIPVFLLNSRLGLFSAAASLQHPFSRSYGVILPSSLTSVLPFVLGFSPCLPVSVCGTGTSDLASSFSRQRGFTCFRYLSSLPIRFQLHGMRTSLHPSLRPSTGSTINRLMLSFCVNASLIKVVLESPPVIHRLRLLSSA